MDKISFSYFIDFVMKTGAPKLSDVKDFKEHKGDLFPDFYMPLREAIVEMHEQGKTPAGLDDLLTNVRDERKRRIYPSLISGYREFLKSQPMTWFKPPVVGHAIGDIEINVNPELGLKIGNTPHIIKMYFRGEPLAQKRISIVMNLLATALRPTNPGVVFSVLDVKNAKLHSLKVPPNPKVAVLLRGEAASFSTMYAAV